MAALIRFFSRRKRKDFADRSLLNNPSAGSAAKSAHKNDIECKVIHLDGQEMTTYLPKKATGRQLYDRVYTNFDFTQEFDYFGLQYMDTANIAQWLDPTKKIKRQLTIGPPYTLHLKVRFFSSEPQNLRDELTRYLFVLQLKKDIVEGNLNCDGELGAELAALSLQAEFGDFDPNEHTPAFVSQFRFMPDNLQTEDFEYSVIEYYKDLSGRNMTPAVADKSYLDKARYLADYGVDMHRVTGKDGRVYQLGLTPTGILVYDNDQKIGFFFWPWIITIGFSKDKLKIIVAEKDDETSVTRDHSFVFALGDPRACKHLWKCCVECHSFFRLVSNNQRPAAGKARGLLRLQSRFYSSYRTEFEMRNANYGSSTRRSARFQRVPSRRFSSRTSFEKAEASRRVASAGAGDEVKSKSALRAERKAETLRRIEEAGSPSPGPPDAARAPPALSTSSALTAAGRDDSPRASANGDTARESVASSASSVKPHKTLVSVEAKVEPPPAPVSPSTSAPSATAVSSSSSASSVASDSTREAGTPKGAALDDGVFADSRAKLVPSHIPTSLAPPPRPPTSSSSRSGFKPARLQEESTDEEARTGGDAGYDEVGGPDRSGGTATSQIPILTRPSARTGPAAPSGPVAGHPGAAAQVPSAPTPPQRQGPVSDSSLPRPRPPASAPAPPATASLSRIPKIASATATASAATPTTTATATAQQPPLPPVSGIPQPPRRASAASSAATAAAAAAGRSASVGGSRIPSLMPAAPPPAAKAQRSASAVSSSSSSSASSASSSSTTPPSVKQQPPPPQPPTAQAPQLPPSRIPALPRTARSEIPRSKTEVKTQFQVETSFSSSVSTSHKLSQGREHVRPHIVDPSVVIVKRDATDANSANGKPAVNKRNGATLKEQISTTV